MAASDAPGLHRRRRADGPIRFHTSFHNTVYDVMCRRGWKEVDMDGAWDVAWADRELVNEIFDTQHMDSHQKVNHYRNCRELCRKDNLMKNVKKMKRQLERDGRTDEAAEFDFCPITFTLPGDYALFKEEFKRLGSRSPVSDWRSDKRWKPENPTVEPYVVQRYISNPYLIGGKKFDMRMYVLVPSFSPLTVWLYRAGFARFSARRYSSAMADVDDVEVHCTNVAIQKHGEHYNAETGGKWDLRSLKMHLISKHGVAAVDTLFQGMEGIVVRSLMSVQRCMITDKHCYELYGYDFLFDADLRPWLIEVNASPSLTANTREDYDRKFKLLHDTFDVVDMEGKLAGDETSIGGFDLIWKDGPVVAHPGSKYTSMLGADFSQSLAPAISRAAPTPVTAAAGAGGSAP
ncbi:Ttll9, partial [Symbiodinium sp. KB8]